MNRFPHKPHLKIYFVEDLPHALELALVLLLPVLKPLAREDLVYIGALKVSYGVNSIL